MGLLLLKLSLTPLLIAAASLAGRRWGTVIGGWLIALPLTSGPVAFFVSLDQGTGFASAEAAGSLLGVLAIAAFALAYGHVALRAGWPAALAAAAATFFAVGLAAQLVLGLPDLLLFVLVVAGVALAATWLPAPPAPPAPGPAPWWEIPGRVVAGTLVVLAITEAAGTLGPGLSGVVAIFPAFVSVLAVFTHRRDGAAHAVGILRGLLAGLPGTAAFFVILGLGLGPLGIGPGFAAALAGCLALQALGLARLRSREGQRLATASIVAR